MATILKYSGEQKADSRSPDKANATTSVIYPLPPQMAHNLTQSEPSGLKMGIRRDNILAPKDDPHSTGFWSDCITKNIPITHAMKYH